MPIRPTAPRLPVIDVLRGLAVAQMIVYHFIYDLNHFGWVKLRMFHEQPWTGWRAAIVTQFLLLVGVSLVLRTAFKPGLRDFWRRWAQIAAAAALVSAGSAWLLGPRFIWFGILHFIAVALVLVLPLVRLGPWNALLGAAAVAAGLVYADDWFNRFPQVIVGLVTHKPITEDYVPLLPWIGVVLLGVGLASLWQRHGWRIAPALRPLNDSPPRTLRWLGTWSLTVYLLHQPLMLGALSALRQLGL